MLTELQKTQLDVVEHVDTLVGRSLPLPLNSLGRAINRATSYFLATPLRAIAIHRPARDRTSFN